MNENMSKMVAKEYNAWMQLVDSNMELFRTEWPDCDDCELDCSCCGWNLVGLEDQTPEFLERVKVLVENCVEELYLRPDLTDEDEAELGKLMAYLVKLYCRYYM